MTATMIEGEVRNGVVVPKEPLLVPEGTLVDITLRREEFTPAERLEHEALEKASDEAWSMIDEWESDPGRGLSI